MTALVVVCMYVCGSGIACSLAPFLLPPNAYGAETEEKRIGEKDRGGRRE